MAAKDFQSVACSAKPPTRPSTCLCKEVGTVESGMAAEIRVERRFISLGLIGSLKGLVKKEHPLQGARVMEAQVAPHLIHHLFGESPVAQEDADEGFQGLGVSFDLQDLFQDGVEVRLLLKIGIGRHPKQGPRLD